MKTRILILALWQILLSTCAPYYSDATFDDNNSEQISEEYELLISSDTDWQLTVTGPYHNDVYENNGGQKIYFHIFKQHLPLCARATKVTEEGKLSIMFRKANSVSREYRGGGWHTTKEPFGTVSDCIGK